MMTDATFHWCHICRQDWSISAKIVGISLLLYFETEADLLLWNSSEERASAVASAVKGSLFIDRHDAIKDSALPWADISRSESSVCSPPTVLPPPKWKLMIVIWLCVAVTALAAVEARTVAGLMEGGWLEYELALFVDLFLSVTMITFGLSPLIFGLHIGGYGAESWMKLPRVKISTEPRKRFVRPPCHNLLRTAME
jgi:hypothetical protein